MSGLCGLVDFSDHPLPAGLLEQMAGAARHRGSAGVAVRAFAAAGLCQLVSLPAAGRIRDLSPRQSADGAICLVADARLDNRSELLAELEPDLPPESRDRADDADLLLAAYRRWGAGCPERLVGDFAFAVWDAPARRLLLARDPLGVKALHYARIGPALCFASEARQLLRHPGLPRRIDETAVSGYLTGWLREPARTFFAGIHRLPPGHQLLASSDGDRLVRFWNPPAERSISRDEAAARFLSVFEQCVADRLRDSGSPVGLLLSGGLDSSSIAAVARKRSGAPLLACTFAFERLRQCDERPFVRQLAEELDLEVAFIDAESRFLLGDPEAYVPALETPFLGWESCNQEALRILQDRGARVLLTGLGADDLLRGSARIVLDRALRGEWRAVRELRGLEGNFARLLYLYLLAPLLPDGVNSALRRLAGKPSPPLFPAWIAPGLARRTRLAERIHGALQGGSSAGGRARREIRRFAVDLAPYERVVYRWELLASAWGIEVRYPFLDRRLFDLVLSLPPEQLYDLHLYKPLLRRAMAGVVPEAVRSRRQKSRLGAFVDDSLIRQAAGRVDDLLRAPLAAEMGFVDRDALRKAWERYRTGTPDPMLRTLWFALTLELWLRSPLTALEGLDTKLVNY